MVGNHRVQSSPEGYVMARMLDVTHVLADCRLCYFCLLSWILGFLRRCRTPLGYIFYRSDVAAYFVAQICPERLLQWHQEEQKLKHGDTCFVVVLAR